MVLHQLLERQTHFYTSFFVNLLSSCPLRRSLERPSDEGFTLRAVGEVLTLEDLKSPVLLDKSDDEDSFVGVRVPEDGSQCARDLRRDYALWSEVM